MLHRIRAAARRFSRPTTEKAAIPVIEQLEPRELFTTYYISPSGSDSWSGTSTSTPWKTLGKVNTKNFNAGDTILLKGGTTFTGKLYFDSNDKGTAASPIRVGSYNGKRASILSPTEFGIYCYNTAGFIINKLNVYGAGSSNTSAGVFFYNDRTDGAKLDGIILDGLDVAGFRYGIEIGGGINAAGGSSTAGFKNITMTNSLLHKNVMAGMFTFGATYNVNENIYLHHNQAYGNYGVSDYLGVSGHGFLIGSANNALLEKNVAYDNGRVGNGGAGIWCYDSNKVTFQYNESHHNRTGGPHDGDGFDLDQNTSNSIMQYNYSHDNDGAGYLLSTKFNNTIHNNNIIRYNISQNDCRKLNYGALHIWGKCSNAEFYNNTVYMAPTTQTYSALRYGVRIVNDSIPLQDVANVHFRNNIIQTTGGIIQCFVSADQLDGGIDLKFQGNCWYSSGAAWKVNWGATTYTSISGWRSGSGQEKLMGNVGTSSNPLLEAPGTGGTFNNADLLTTLTAYRLQSSSPLINTALNLNSNFGINPGTRDYLGHTLPQGSGYDFGACEYVPA